MDKCAGVIGATIFVNREHLDLRATALVATDAPSMTSSIALSPSRGTAVRGDQLLACYVGDSTAAGVREGQGCYNFPNRYYRYEGDYVDGKKHGAPCLGFPEQCSSLAHTSARPWNCAQIG